MRSFGVRRVVRISVATGALVVATPVLLAAMSAQTSRVFQPEPRSMWWSVREEFTVASQILLVGAAERVVVEVVREAARLGSRSFHRHKVPQTFCWLRAEVLVVPLGLAATSATVADRRADLALTAAREEVSPPVDRQVRVVLAVAEALHQAVHSFRAAVE